MMFLSIIEIDQADASTYNIDRISGADRYDTAVKISKEQWTTAKTVVLAVGDNFPDALAGAPLAHKLNAPILLSSKDSINKNTLNEIKRLKASTVVILGGPSVISKAAEKQLTDLNIKIDRIQGANRSETSAKIAQRIGGSKAIVVNGATFADSLAVASYAAKNQYPILLTGKNEMDPSVKKEVGNYTSTYVVGGTAAVSKSVYNALPKPTRISGKDRYETAAKVTETLYSSTVSTATAATGEGFADALTGSTYAANKNQPVLLVRKASVPAAVRDVLKKKKTSNIVVIGGKQVVQDSAFDPPKPIKNVDTGAEIVTTAKKYIGTPYLWGGTTPSGFDCSGYLNYVFDKHGIDLPRTTADIWSNGKKVSSPKIGDIVMFETYKPGASHGGIYIGDNQFIHSGDNGVEITSLSNSYWSKAYIGAVDYINK
ncbi:N-acetylmuramoyl-L-alanine amidase [Jeotgalibacillus sp. S-D1]|nr:N-acetylmuramoyl-L-alanine amidase [Jeotgalibacillus sp. S-D1]